jgi:hypothetical protein
MRIKFFCLMICPCSCCSLRELSRNRGPCMPPLRAHFSFPVLCCWHKQNTFHAVFIRFSLIDCRGRKRLLLLISHFLLCVVLTISPPTSSARKPERQDILATKFCGLEPNICLRELASCYSSSDWNLVVPRFFFKKKSAYSCLRKFLFSCQFRYFSTHSMDARVCTRDINQAENQFQRRARCWPCANVFPQKLAHKVHTNFKRILLPAMKSLSPLMQVSSRSRDV